LAEALVSNTKGCGFESLLRYHFFMKALVLEDAPERIEWFTYKFGRVCVPFDQTDDPQTAIKLLQENNYTHIFLDHDLLDEHYFKDVTCNKTTGLCVAEWLADNPENNPQCVIIMHTMNENGARRMMQALEKGGRLPTWIWYPELKKRLIVNPLK
jgi:CheY-like chemotaxis protein